MDIEHPLGETPSGPHAPGHLTFLSASRAASLFLGMTSESPGFIGKYSHGLTLSSGPLEKKIQVALNLE